MWGHALSCFWKIPRPSFAFKADLGLFEKHEKHALHSNIVNKCHQVFLLLSSWGTSQNIIPSNSPLYKVPPLFSPFLRYDVIADKAQSNKQLPQWQCTVGMYCFTVT